MENWDYHYIDTLEQELGKRQKNNPHYSLRSFARDLGLHPATLSMVLNRKRQLPKKDLAQTLKALSLSPLQESLFKESYYKNKTKLDDIQIDPEFLKRTLLDESYYRIIAHWEYYAIITLLEIPKKSQTPEMIASELGINLKRVQLILKELEKANLIAQSEDGFVLSSGKLRTTEDISSRALKESHKETLDMAKQKIEEVEVELRDYSSMTIAINPQKLPEAKTIIREFRQKIGSLLRDGDKQEVYQLAIQLFPLTKKQGI